MKKILFLCISLFLIHTAYAQTVICDPVATINKMKTLEDPLGPVGDNPPTNCSFNNGNNIAIGDSTGDTCFIISNINACGIGEGCSLNCCISKGVATYTIICLDPVGPSEPIVDFTFFNNEGERMQYSDLNSSTFEIYGDPDRNVKVNTLHFNCNACIESILSDYLKETYGKNLKSCNDFFCTITKTQLGSNTVALNANLYGCSGNINVLGWKAISFSTGLVTPLGGGLGCPVNNVCFSAPGGAHTMCFEAVCNMGYGVQCKTSCCELICEFVGELDPVTKSIKVDKNINNNIDIFPIPANETLYIRSSSEVDKAVQVEIYNVLGNRVKEINLDVTKGINKYKLDITGLPKGNYIVKYDTKGSNIVKKIVVQ